MSSRLKQTTIDVGNFAALMSPRPAGGRGSVAPVSAAPPGRHAGTLAGLAKSPSGRTQTNAKAHPAGWALHLFDARQFPTLTWGDPTLPSALRRFTSEFGMGSGGTTALVPPGKFFVLSTQFFIASAALPALVKSVTYFSMLLPFRRLSPCCCANYCVLNSESKLKILSIRQNIFGVVRLSLTVH